MIEKILVGLIVAAAAGFVLYRLLRSLRGDKCQCPNSAGCPYSGNCPGPAGCYNRDYFHGFSGDTDRERE